jgi:hypothetical protein
MSVTDHIVQLAHRQNEGSGRKSKQISKMLKGVDKVEAMLKEMGVSIEPVFDISLDARISGGSKQRRWRLSRRVRSLAHGRA